MEQSTNTNSNANANGNAATDSVTIPVTVTITNSPPTIAIAQSPPPPPASSQTIQAAAQSTSGPTQTVSAPNLITVPVPIVHHEENYTYVVVKGSVHDRSCSVFGINDEERQALTKRFESVKPVVNGCMVSISPVEMINTLAQLSYKVVCTSGEAEICWTMQREI